MPNGADVAGGSGLISLAVTLGSFIGGFFGGGGPTVNPQAPVPSGFTPSGRFEGFIDVRTGLPPTEQVLFGAEHGNLFLQRALVRAPIPTPAEGGPPLVTERFAQLPGPFVPEPDLPILQELGIPFVPAPLQIFPFEPGFPLPPGIFPRIPEPDAPELEEIPDIPRLEEIDMAADAPLLAGFLPAVRGALPQVAGPTAGAIGGGLISDVLSGLFARAPQETGLGQIPLPARRGALPAGRPSTQILRRIHMSTGVRVKLSSAKSLIRQLGLQNGARCLGISITEACTLIITPSPRRRRGISGSDIRIVKRTARRFQALQEDLSGLGRRRGPTRRRVRHVKTAAIAHA